VLGLQSRTSLPRRSLSSPVGRHFSSQVVLRRYPVNGRLLKRAIGGTGAFNWRTESK
jgi:hypothetical protein